VKLNLGSHGTNALRLEEKQQQATYQYVHGQEPNSHSLHHSHFTKEVYEVDTCVNPVFCCAEPENYTS
jgi:hypothetical protein